MKPAVRPSFSKLFNLSFLLAFALVFAGAVSAWTGPTGTAPANNVSAPVNVGATSQVKSGGLGVASLLSTGEIAGTLAAGYGQFRMVAGNYGSFFRNDGTNTYLLLTNSGDQYGAWNALRPFYVNNATGAVTISSGLAVNSLTVNGSPVSSSGGPHLGAYWASPVSAVSNAHVVFTGAANSAPTYSAGVLTLPSNTAYYTVELRAGGGGGSGSSSGNCSGSGSAGSPSCFGTSATACTSPLVRAGTTPSGDIIETGPAGLAGGMYGAGGSSQGGPGSTGGYAMKLITGTTPSYFTIGAGGAGGGCGGQGSFSGSAGAAGGMVVTVYEN